MEACRFGPNWYDVEERMVWSFGRHEALSASSVSLSGGNPSSMPALQIGMFELSRIHSWSLR
jgi:hypothetical protein